MASGWGLRPASDDCNGEIAKETYTGVKRDLLETIATMLYFCNLIAL
jgi:hypothetical protein